jgi:integrase
MFKATSLCQQFLTENFWLAASTRETTERAFRNFARATGNRRIDRFGPDDGERFKGWMLRTGRSKTTANIYLRSVSRVFNWAVVTKRLIKENPISATKQFKVTRNPIVIYEDWQVGRMLRCAPDLRWQAIILTAWTTGLRRGAILNLTRDNIRGDYVFVEPKRNTKMTWEWEPKDREIRKVPLVPQLKKILDRLGDSFYLLLAKSRYERNIEASLKGLLSERLRKCPEENFRRKFVAIQKKAFGRQIGDFHRFRKTYTTIMCGKLPDYFVMRLTGHSNLKTMTYYLASRESYFDQARQIASDAIKEGPSINERPHIRIGFMEDPMGDTGLEPVASCV